MATKKVLKKIIKNWVEYYLPEWWGGGWSVDTATVNSLIDLKMRDYDSIFRIDTDLYKILNDIDTEDELGLSSWSDWETICADETSMNKISHSYAVMVMVASSDVALQEVIESSTALDEIIECWNSMRVISDSEKAMNYFLSDDDIIEALFESQVALDAIFSSDIGANAVATNENVIEYIFDWAELSIGIWQQLFKIDVFCGVVLNNTTYLNYIASDDNALTAIMTSEVWNTIMSDYDLANIFFSNENSKDVVVANTDSSTLSWDIPMRLMATNDLLDDYLDKDDYAFNSIVAFDVKIKSSATAFQFPVYWASGVSYNWLYSIDWGEFIPLSWNRQQTYISTTALAVWDHTIVLKPVNYEQGWASCLGSYDGYQYWNNNYNYCEFVIKNIYYWSLWREAYWLNNVLKYWCYYTSSLVGIWKIKANVDWNMWNDCLSHAFYYCTKLKSVLGWYLTPRKSSWITVGNNYMYQMFYNCNSMTTFNAIVGVEDITTTWTYFMYDTFHSCLITSFPNMSFSKLTQTSDYFLTSTFQNSGLTTSPNISLPLLTTIWSYFLQFTFYGCRSLTTSWSINAPSISTAPSCFMYQTFMSCGSLATVGSITLNWLRTVDDTFMYRTYYNCSNIVKMPNGFNLSQITSVTSSSFLNQTWYGCSKLEWMPEWFDLPHSWYNSNWCVQTWRYCSALTSNSPTIDIYFVYDGSNTFLSTGVSTTSPTAWSTVAIHKTT